MKDNSEKWNDSINDSFKYPDGLDSVENRLEMRINKAKRRKRTLVSSISSIAACILFVLLVNTSTAFANAVSELPVIGKLAEYVKLDKRLSKSIENEYAQEVNLVAWDGNNRLLLPYIIADEKHLILFFQLPEEFKQESNQWVDIFINNIKNGMTGEALEGYVYSTSGMSPEGREQNFGFVMQEYHFVEGKLPKSVDIEVELKIENIATSDEVRLTDYEGENKAASSSLEIAGSFNFHIEIDDFVEPKIYEINEKHTILGQQVTLENMKVYPIGTEVNLSFAEENSSWIKGLDLEVLQDGVSAYGENNGTSATHDDENKWMRVYIESNYFDKPKKQELLIKAVRLLDKDEEYITVDIDNETITPAVEGMELKQVIKNSNNATLIFSTRVSDNDSFGMFNPNYKDTDGNVYELISEGNSSYNSQLEITITLKYPPSGKVILQRLLTPKIILGNPIRINIPQ